MEKSHSTTELTSSREKARKSSISTSTTVADTQSQVFTTLPSGERRSTKEVWVDGRSAGAAKGAVVIVAGGSESRRGKRMASVDGGSSSYESARHSQSASHSHSHSQSASQIKTTTTTTTTSKSGGGFFGGLFSGRSETISDRSKKEKKEEKEEKREEKKEAKRVSIVIDEGGKGGKVFMGRDGKISRGEESESESGPVKLTKVYPMV
ncbi:hypothetical protein P167DRAFT_532173 [Morchella conica CCBAS932]|uniref:Uncharacterized protein n=1 Tax=Morchella conica CCBAS932 TaxID=1392247 RepID=A0A3N4L1D1_9PEZI|nr:hypothetical protein P167DRAFT_532173 [Morchella conica CCBAS932]